MAAIGDSITQAAVLSPTLSGSSQPQYSWATGTTPDDSTVSHYERILAAAPAIAGKAHNVAVSGAQMRDAPDQAARAVAQRPGYVTFLMGANDVCRPRGDEMTSVIDFAGNLQSAVGILSRGAPEARLLVLSVPDVSRLWRLFKDDRRARAIWAVTGACPRLLGSDVTDEERDAARQRILDYNGVLREVCGRTPLCRFDDNAVFEHKTKKSDVSTLDFFHPSPDGQRRIAEISWAKGYWPKV